MGSGRRACACLALKRGKSPWRLPMHRQSARRVSCPAGNETRPDPRNRSGCSLRQGGQSVKLLRKQVAIILARHPALGRATPGRDTFAEAVVISAWHNGGSAWLPPFTRPATVVVWRCEPCRSLCGRVRSVLDIAV